MTFYTNQIKKFKMMKHYSCKTGKSVKKLHRKSILKIVSERLEPLDMQEVSVKVALSYNNHVLPRIF